MIKEKKKINNSNIITFGIGLIVFVFAYLLLWAIAECTIPIYTDDMIYANWAQHDVKYFFEQLIWHYNNFNGRSLTHSLLAILLMCREHLYAIAIPLSMSFYSFLMYGVVNKNAKFGQKLLVSGITLLGFAGLSKFYLTYSVIWMSSGANYIIPLLFVSIAYVLYLRTNYTGKHKVFSLLFCLLASATTEQYSLYLIGLIVLTTLFDIFDKKKVNACWSILSVVIAGIGLCSLLFAPGIISRSNGHMVDMHQIIDIFFKNNYTLSGYVGHANIMCIIILCFGLIGTMKQHRILLVGIAIAFANYFLYLFGFHNIAALIFTAYILLIVIHFMRNKYTREYAKILICGYGTFIMMCITDIGGFRVCIPFLFSVIFVLASIYLSEIFYNKNNNAYIGIVVCVLALCFNNGLGFYQSAKNTSVNYSEPLYEEMSNAKETGIINVNYDYADVYNELNNYRHNTCFDSGMLLDIKYNEKYFGYTDDVVYHHVSEKQNVLDVTFNGKYYVVPVISQDGKTYVPYTLLVMNQKTKCENVTDYIENNKDKQWNGHIIDKNNIYAMSSDGDLLTILNGNIVYEKENCDYILQYFKTSPSKFIELSQFCKWANVTYTYDSTSNTYHFTQN